MLLLFVMVLPGAGNLVPEMIGTV